jgi:predicted dehydrogenase
MSQNASSRRRFLKQLSNTTLLLSAGSLNKLMSEEVIEERMLRYNRTFSSNDTIRLGLIGAGIIGHYDVQTALKVPGVELTAVSDLYTGRLDRVKEVFGKQIYTNKDYREVLERKDVDAIIVATSDHWHDRISIDALKKGKGVYCEKPMVNKISKGPLVIKAQKETGKIFQVGSQRVSSIALIEAKKLYQAGEIGQLNCIEACFDRHSAIGAWQYTLPLDASPETVDWERYLGDAPKHPFDANRFFRWRNYRDYGTGVAGDLFVHLITGAHFLTDAKGPSRIFATGDLCYWKDGRDVPDVMTAIMEYAATANHPAFQVMLRVNFASGQGDVGVTKLVGSEGVIDFGWNDFTLTQNKLPKAPGIGGYDSLNSFTADMQKRTMDNYNKLYTKEDAAVVNKPAYQYKAPADYDDRLDHFVNFFDALRTGKPVVEDAVFGFRAAAPCLAANESYFTKKVINWDPENMRVVKS